MHFWALKCHLDRQLTIGETERSERLCVISEVEISQQHVRVRECWLWWWLRGYSVERYRYRIIDARHLLSKTQRQTLNYSSWFDGCAPLSCLLSYIAARAWAWFTLTNAIKQTWLRDIGGLLQLVVQNQLLRQIQQEATNCKSSKTYRKFGISCNW